MIDALPTSGIWGDEVRKKLVLAVGLSFLLCAFLLSGQHGQIGDIVNKFKHSEVGRVFLRDHSEKNLETVLAFLQDPVRNFRRVQAVADVCSYIYAYVRYLAETKENDDAGYKRFYRTHFRIATDDNVPILIYLVLNCHNALFMEELTDRYTVLFKESPEVFIRDLRRRANWRQVVDEIRGGNWGAFKDGLAKLGNSGFERELKNYALAISK